MEDEVQKAASAKIGAWELAHSRDQLGTKLEEAATPILAELTRIRFEMTAIRKLLESR
jgi:hypothetical protein